MLETRTLVVDSEHIALLDDHALASIRGGEGPLSWLAKKVGDLLWDCLSGDLDSVIAAAKEGYEDAR